jgi:hypothetical protein
MRFDWYQATIPAHPLALVDALLADLAPDGQVIPGAGRHNYHQSFTINDASGHRVALVLAGGPNGDPNATGSGPITDAFVQSVRSRWPSHNVTRFDSSEDFCAVGSWDVLERTCRTLAADMGIKGRAIVPDDPADGRTYYMGAPTSDVRVRLYEKTAELRRSLPPSRWGEVPDNVVRLEAQVRPRKQHKAVAAAVNPVQAWGFSRWTAELALRAMALEVERIEMQAGRESDDQRAWRFMLKQYGPLLRRHASEVGSWECLGLNIRDDLDRL